MSRAARIAVVAVPAIGLLAAPSCASVLDLTGHEDAVAAMCQCNEQLSFLGNRCEDLLESRLAGASESTRRKWLENFDDEKCEVCENVEECFYAKPTCGTGTTCSSSKECCGYLDGSGYCHGGLCRHREPTCLGTFQACTSNEQCCGSEAGLGTCHPTQGICLEECVSGEEANCPNCCAHLTGAAFAAMGGEFFTCFRGEDSEVSCDLLCGPSKGCAVGLVCASFEIAEGEQSKLCTPEPPIEAACLDVCTPPGGQ